MLSRCITTEQSDLPKSHSNFVMKTLLGYLLAYIQKLHWRMLEHVTNILQNLHFNG